VHTASSAGVPARTPGIWLLAGAALLGGAVAVALGVYSAKHKPAGQAYFTLGFSGTLNMKAWLATFVVAFAIVQVVLALWMYGKLPGFRLTPPWVGSAHQLVGMLAFVTSLPVAYHCLWSLGFESDTASTRRFVHSVLGCAFYGAFTTKMVCVRSHRMPQWALPVLGGLVFTILVALWLTSSLWFFDHVGFPSF